MYQRVKRLGDVEVVPIKILSSIIVVTPSFIAGRLESPDGLGPIMD